MSGAGVKTGCADLDLIIANRKINLGDAADGAT